MKYKLYLTGGLVRDELLGIESKDMDYSVVFDAEHFIESPIKVFKYLSEDLARKKFEIFLETPDCFTIRAKFPEDDDNAGLVADFVLARKDGAKIEGTRRAEVSLGTLEDDLARRDFTVNALAKDGDKIIDIFGGQEDLYKGILDTPLDPMVTMMDDPLRMLRGIRFSVTKGFTIADRVWEAMSQEGLIDSFFEVVSVDRIRDELTKAFKVDTAQTIMLLLDLGGEAFLHRLFEGKMWLKPSTEG